MKSLAGSCFVSKICQRGQDIGPGIETVVVGTTK